MPEVRLIDANALKDRIDSAFTTYGECTYVKGIIDAQPTIEAEPVRHASWHGWTTSRFTGKYKDYYEPEFKDYQYYQCTACYRKSAIKELYCPNCGADMRGGADNGFD